jgi:hypothetical protein
MKPIKSITDLPVVLVAVVLFVAACGPSQTPTPEVDAVATQVAAVVYTQGAETVVAMLTQNAPTQPVETATPLPPPPTETALPLPTNTPIPPTETPAPTSTPTTSTGDPVQSLGSPTYLDNFDRTTNWTLFDDNCFKSEIEDGRYRMTGKGLGYTCWEISWPQVQNFYLEVKIQSTDICPGTGSFGLLLRAPNAEQGYIYSISCDGKYSFWSWDGQIANYLVNPTQSAQIAAGPNQFNRIGVVAEDNLFRLYINGVLQTEVDDNLFLEKGFFGLNISAFENEPFTVLFDDLAYWELPED